jgi:1,4-dihydroxy-2-naphthoyl-CoA hydrolase
VPPLTEISPFDALYGLRLQDATPELVRGSVAVRDELRQPTGVLHGGVYAAVAEGLASLGTNVAVSAAGQFALGMSNSTSFLRPVAEGLLHGVALCRHRGRTTAVWDVEMTDDDGKLCAVSRVTLAIREQRR